MSEKNFNVISRCAPWTCTLVCLLVCNLKKIMEIQQTKCVQGYNTRECLYQNYEIHGPKVSGSAFKMGRYKK